MGNGRCGECSHDLIVFGHHPKCLEGGIVRQPGDTGGSGTQCAPPEPMPPRPPRWWRR